MRYIDTGGGDRAGSVGTWLDENVLSGIKGFRCQFGYFRFAALAPYASVLRESAQAGHPVHVVLGSNGGSLVAQDVQRALRIVEGTSGRLSVVAFTGAEFHPKDSRQNNLPKFQWIRGWIS